MIAKKELNMLVLVLLGIFFITASVSACALNVNLINQDPYPVMPGENMKVVFQITGVENSACGKIQFKFVENFPFEVDKSMSAEKSIQGGTFIRDYSNVWLVPLIIRVDSNAKEGTNKLDVLISNAGQEGGILNSFDIDVKDVKTDFEIHAKDYSISKGTITFEILNVGKNNVDALSIEIPVQDNIQMKGSNKNTLGILDSNEYTTTTFEAVPKAGEINFIIRYNDITGTRRTIEKSIYFDPSPFILKEQDNGKVGTSTIIISLIILILIVYFIYRGHKKKKERKKLLQHHK